MTNGVLSLRERAGFSKDKMAPMRDETDVVVFWDFQIGSATHFVWLDSSPLQPLADLAAALGAVVYQLLDDKRSHWTPLVNQPGVLGQATITDNVRRWQENPKQLCHPSLSFC